MKYKGINQDTIHRNDDDFPDGDVLVELEVGELAALRDLVKERVEGRVSPLSMQEILYYVGIWRTLDELVRGSRRKITDMLSAVGVQKKTDENC